MAPAEETSKFCEAYPMKGGDGPNSYANNSTYQRGVVDAAKELLSKAIAEKLDIDILLSSNSFQIADLGCSVGPNTFFAVENIVEAAKFKFQSQGKDSQVPEFQVFFNDHTPNDFNMLFKSLPQNRRYYAVGVPGSFYGRIFPNASIHFVHSSYAIQWLSSVPKVVVDKTSPAWNKGRIHYLNSPEEVARAYEAQYTEDMECFLHARAQEIVYGGLMVLTVPGRPNGSSHSHSSINMSFQLLGSALMDLARKGGVSEEKVDSFNIPIYCMSSQELEAAVERNGSFSIESMENLPHVSVDDTVSKSQLFAAHMRAGMEGLVKQKFGEEILDELFDLFRKKFEEAPFFFETGKTTSFLCVLRRKGNGLEHAV
ncbi:Hypothetical predicted protein [Prunus dulcis]|uniref:S-adenosyl-L-methionine-dependent methyltransferases superfamily protein n=1 Tax=Prunus dulcis TaxID=3755 RepID=A0A5E4FZS2_PRUDU|nr:loganic acid O-methyltransferase-like [Prunus dulcis]VVA33061.1 Hypothetical predicted protein [Prunus dulcis]